MSQPKKKEEKGVMTTEIARIFPHQGKWTEDEYFNLPDTNYILELSDGRLEIQEMPGDDHQNAIMNLSVAI